MLTVISPAKRLDYESQNQTAPFTNPEFLDDADKLIKKLRTMSRRALSELMGISDDLAALNQERFAHWSRPFTLKNAKQAILAFNGDVYSGLEAGTFGKRDLNFAQDHLRILSGLYGVLRPLDLMQPYRLEMGTKLTTRRGKTLYDFWGETITTALNAELAQHKSDVLINLASNEYFKSVKSRLLTGRVITPVFKEIKGGKARTLATFAKRARGRFTAWLIRNRIETPAQLTEFDMDNYEFVADDSTDETLVFVRPQPLPVSAARKALAK